MVALKIQKYIMYLVMLVLIAVFVSAVANPVANPVDVKVIGSATPSSNTFDVTVSLNPKDQAVIGMDLYLTSSDGSVTFSDGKSTDLWLKGAKPLVNSAESKGVVWHFVIPAGTVFDKSSVDKNVFTVTATTSKKEGTIKVDTKSGVSIYKQGTASVTSTDLAFTVSGAQCKDACTEKTIQCSVNKVQSCTKGVNGCTAWVDGNDCGADKTCTNGNCVAKVTPQSGDKDGDDICSTIKGGKGTKPHNTPGYISKLASKLKSYFG